jgi:hypothetical protein
LTDPMTQPQPADTSQFNMPALIRWAAAGPDDANARASAAAAIAFRYM